MNNFRFEVEEIILEMASMVMENRYLQKENERLQKVEKEYHEYINKRCRIADESSKNMLKCALVGVAMGKDDRELAKELVEFM